MFDPKKETKLWDDLAENEDDYGLTIILCIYMVCFVQGPQSALSDGSLLFHLFLQDGETEA